MNTNGNNQVVVRVTAKLDKRIERAAVRRGLKKASWVRQLIIEALDKQDGLKNE